jgi:hypothetical protein
MDEQKMRALAVEAAKRFAGELASRTTKVELGGLPPEEYMLKIKGVYQRPLTNYWQIIFQYFQIRYAPEPDASDEKHVEKIVELLRMERGLR